MKISSVKLQQAVEALRRMGARRVVVYGEAAETPENTVDVDLAVEGIPVTKLVEASAAVHELLGVPTDLLTREENPALYKLVSRFGLVLYQNPKPAAPHPF